jgi:hypothetical protein
VRLDHLAKGKGLGDIRLLQIHIMQPFRERTRSMDTMARRAGGHHFYIEEEMGSGPTIFFFFCYGRESSGHGYFTLHWY